MDPARWTPERLTARDVVAHRDVALSFYCQGCRMTVEFDVWKVGARLADDPLQTLRFRCRRCGVYPSTLMVARRNGMSGVHLFEIPLKPRSWDESHEEKQAVAMRRAREQA
ncbi:hypothetical protein [Brevundimonas naejangsanensis]|uniref:hypothetical protein n=1 Tax=Brevundimonas naejangsanensis TaxID=588932 RepID=UPI0026F27257|nr:hypothetical protein [Brevundimonas naejangsanensis]